MKIKVGKTVINGAGVIPKDASEFYKMDISAAGKLDLFIFNSCHREETKEKAGGEIFSTNKVEVEYQPVEGIETSYCPLQFSGAEIKGRHSWAFLDIERNDTRLVATNRCNGKTYRGTVSVCQSKAGLIQEIIFSEPVKLYEKAGCEMDTEKESMAFRYHIKPKECIYSFISKNKEVHRLTTLGYEEVLVRE